MRRLIETHGQDEVMDRLRRAVLTPAQEPLREWLLAIAIATRVGQQRGGSF